jgi:histidine triad (HIT) family protein
VGSSLVRDGSLAPCNNLSAIRALQEGRIHLPATKARSVTTQDDRPPAAKMAAMAPGSAPCVFCAIVRGEQPAAFVLGGPGAGGDGPPGEVVAFLDRRPLFKGHTLVVPRVHHETLVDLPAELVAPVFGAARGVAAAMEEALGAAGSFVALNNRVSQSVPHLHVHVVPRNRKDGLRGFFWPRTRYADDAEQDAYAGRIRAALP